MSFREDTRTTVASSKILRDGEEVGTVRTMRVKGVRGERIVHQVSDRHLNALGYIDEQNCAFRLTAHSGAELVGNSSDRRRNVAAILGAFGANIELVEEGPAATIERDAATGSRQPPAK